MERKIAWLESQYLFPHHFQQQDRYVESLVAERSATMFPYGWGFTALDVDATSLADGEIAVTRAQGVMPDGTPFDLPAADPLPRPARIPANARDTTLYLVLPKYTPGVRHLDTGGDVSGEGIPRYRLQARDVYDYAVANGPSESVETAALNCALMLGSEQLAGYSSLPLARIREVTREGAVVLDPAFIPTVLHVGADERLVAHLGEVLGLLHQRGEALAMRFNETGKAGGTSAIADFLMLQLINRYEPRLRHLDRLSLLHPEVLYRELLGLMGELATFTTREKRPSGLTGYRHDDLQSCFAELGDRLAAELSAVLEETAIPLPVEERRYGIRVARVPDRNLLKQARFVLAVKADATTEELREQVPRLIKAGTVESIRDLVNNQLPGIQLEGLPVAPREIRYHAGCVYFELDRASDQWRLLDESGGFAFHVSGNLANLVVELWAIRE